MSAALLPVNHQHPQPSGATPPANWSADERGYRKLKKNGTKPDEKRLHPRKAGVKHLSIYFIKAYGKSKTPPNGFAESLVPMPPRAVVCDGCEE
jgi:hypothetical protein